MKTTKNYLTCFLLLCFSHVSIAASDHHLIKRTHDDGVSFPYEAPKNHIKYLNKIDPQYLPYMQAQPEMINQWQDDRFGVFIHWDHSSQVPVSMSWGRKGARPHHSTDGKVTKGVPEQEYNDLAKSFNPKNFDAGKWMDIIESAGAKYVVFTAKHHAGFSMWDTKVSDFKITNTPYAKDVTKQLVAEAHKRGIKFHFYYSQPDWYEELYRDKKNKDKFNREFLFPQIRELLTQYGKIDGIWFDGLGKGIDTWYGPELITMMRKLQPHLVVNHRWGNPSWRFGDYDGPERKIGRFQINRPWETCTIIGGGWGWMGDQPPMAYNDTIDLLSITASRGGNLLLNTGPTALGEINPSHAQRFKEMGQWLTENGESIYGTRGGPYIDGPWGGSTRKGNIIYLHLYGDVGSKISLPDLPIRVTSAALLAGGEVEVSQVNKKLTLTLSERATTGTVVKLEVNADVTHLPVIATINNAVSLSATATSSSDKNSKFTAEKMVSGSATNFSEGINIRDSWSPKVDDKAPWIELQLHNKEPIDYLRIGSQSYGKLITEGLGFVVKLKVDGQWQQVYQAAQLKVSNGIVFDKTYQATDIRIEFSSSKQLNINEIIAYSAK